jgi:predicted MFS family arabinose efflux permease
MEKTKLSSLWIVSVLFFAYQFILRLSPGVLIDELMIKYQISASTFGFLISVYYASYAAMQIPIGILIDRFGVRNMVAISSLICVIGNLLLIISDQWELAVTGRIIVGIGSSSGVLAAISAARISFSSKHLSKTIGITIMIGLLGAIYGKSINRLFMNVFGLEKSILYLSIPGILIAIAMLVFVKKGEHITEKLNSYSIKSSIKEVMKGKVILLSIAGALLVGPLGAFADVFGEPYLVSVYHLTPSNAGYLTTSTIYIGLCVGAPLLAAIADRFKCHFTINIVCGCVMALIFYIMLNKMVTNYTLMLFSMFIVGIMSAYQVIVISQISSTVTVNATAMAVAFVNMCNMIAITLYNLTIGRLLDYYWTGEIIHSKRVYSEIAYTDALYILPVTLMLGVIMFFILKPRRGVC